MAGERLQRIQDLFEAAQLVPETRRREFLLQACLDRPSLCAEVEELLDSSARARAAGFLVPPPAELAELSVLIGCRVGPYEITRHLATGGMGEVYLANRVAYFAQQVAIKLIRSDLDADLTHFLWAEMQTLANLAHPNIAHLLDGGVTDEGEPYLVMEYVQGHALNHYCEHHHLPIRQRIGLLATVCRAVDFAHQHQVLHRDLKPDNILVTDAGVPKVLDFGLAKTADEAPPGAAGPRELLLGTPEYMAPEQVAGHRSPPSPATDVYSLGAILYELLIGRPPFRAETTQQTLCEVRDREPARPRSLCPGLHPDLEAVCLKCLEKSPARRYPGAQALADDLQRYLDGYPVQARPVTALGRGWRWARRQPRVAALSAALFLAVVTGFGLVTWQWRRAELHLEQTQTQAEETRLQKQQAQRNFQQAFQSVREFTDLSRHPHLQLPLLYPFRKELLEKALDYYGRMTEQAGDADALQVEMAIAYLEMGSIHLLMAQPGKAETELARAKGLLERLEQVAPPDPRLPALMASTYFHLAKTHDRLGRHNQGRQCWQRSRVLLEAQAVRGGPPEVPLRPMLAIVYLKMAQERILENRTKEAVADFRRAESILLELQQQNANDPDPPLQLGTIYRDLAVLERQPALTRKALEAFQEARACWDRLLGPDAQDPQRYQLIGLYLNLGKLQLTLKQRREALVTLQEAVRLAKGYATASKNAPAARQLLAVSLYQVGRVHASLGAYAPARESFDQALTFFKQSMKADPSDAAARRDVGVCLHELGRLHDNHLAWEPAVKAFQEALALRQDMQKRQPEDIQLRLDLTATGFGLGRVLEKLQRPQEALPAYRLALEQQYAVWQINPEDTTYLGGLNQRYERLIRLLRQLGQREDADRHETEWSHVTAFAWLAAQSK